MKMRHLVLMLLEASGGSINSKTKIQKEMYFLSLLMDQDFGFKAHYYGPYSPEVEEGLDELIGAGFVDMRREGFGAVSRGFEVQKYDFFLTDIGKEMASYLIEEYADKYSKIKGLVEKLKEIGELDYLNLSIAAKAYFVLDKKGSPMGRKEIIKKAKKFDWNISSDDINSAVKILEKLNLVKMGE